MKIKVACDKKLERCSDGERQEEIELSKKERERNILARFRVGKRTINIENSELEGTQFQNESLVYLFIYLIYVRVSTITAIWMVGHRLRSTPTNGHRFTALSLPWRSPIQVLTWLDVA